MPDSDLEDHFVQNKVRNHLSLLLSSMTLPENMIGVAVCYLVSTQFSSAFLFFKKFVTCQFDSQSFTREVLPGMLFWIVYLFCLLVTLFTDIHLAPKI